jgi:hypothetical protein
MVDRLIDLLLPIGEEEVVVESDQSLPDGLQAEAENRIILCRTHVI